MKYTNYQIMRLGLCCLLIILIAPFLSGQTIKIKKYFPLKEGDQYSYKSTFNNKEYSEKLECRTVTTSRGETIFYFDDVLNPSTIIGSNMFGLGSYKVDAEGIMALETFWRKDIEKLDTLKPHLMLPKKFKLQDSISLEIDNRSTLFTINFLALESITVPAGEFKNCLKVHIRSVWDSGTVYHEYIWLAKGIGMVKWQRTTGKIEELTYFKGE